MNLRDLLRDVPVRSTSGDLDLDITSVTPDSRLVKPGALFVAIPGTAKDGAEFIPQAVEKGASAIVSLPTAHCPLPTAFVDDARAALSLIAANFYGRPADKLSLVGVTGTSGKTTTTRMIESVFDASGEPVGLIGTIEYRAGDEHPHRRSHHSGRGRAAGVVREDGRRRREATRSWKCPRTRSRSSARTA